MLSGFLLGATACIIVAGVFLSVGYKLGQVAGTGSIVGALSLSGYSIETGPPNAIGVPGLTVRHRSDPPLPLPYPPEEA